MSEELMHWQSPALSGGSGILFCVGDWYRHFVPANAINAPTSMAAKPHGKPHAGPPCVAKVQTRVTQPHRCMAPRERFNAAGSDALASGLMLPQDVAGGVAVNEGAGPRNLESAGMSAEIEAGGPLAVAEGPFIGIAGA